MKITEPNSREVFTDPVEAAAAAVKNQPTPEYICVGRCPMSQAATRAVVYRDKYKCVTCQREAAWVGKDAEERVKSEPGLVSSVRRKYR